MHSLPARSFAALGTAILLLAPSSFAFDSPLSETAVREAYFLGQRRDETMARALDKYTKRLPLPKSGPQVAAVTFFTPFALVVQSSNEHMSYSAQQAEIDHRKEKESVKIIVEIQLTDSYGALITRPTGADSGSPTGYMLRPYDFWKDVSVQVFNSDQADAQILEPFTSSGKPNYICGGDYGGCRLTGATMEFEFPAEAFSAGSAIVQIDPPEGERVSVRFDLASLR